MKTGADLFQNLFVFDKANNHMVDVEHGIKIINELHKVTAAFDFPYAVKFQYRDLDSFIHPSYKGSFEFKYVKRFQETRPADLARNPTRNIRSHSTMLSLCENGQLYDLVIL